MVIFVLCCVCFSFFSFSFYMYRPSYYGLWLPDINKDWLIDWLIDWLNVSAWQWRGQLQHLVVRSEVTCTDVMTSSKRDVAVSRLASLLHEWDSGSKSVRRRILQDFVAMNQRRTAPELDAEFADAASLFLTRITSWLRLTYPSISPQIDRQLQTSVICDQFVRFRWFCFYELFTWTYIR